MRAPHTMQQNSTIHTFLGVDTLVDLPASTKTWLRICSELDQGNFMLFSRDMETDLLHSLAQWPDELRVAPDRWVDLLLQGEIPLGLSLIKTLRIHRQIDDTIWIKLMNHPSLAHLTRLEVSGDLFDEKRARFLARTSSLKSLESLSISSVELSTEALDVLLAEDTAWHDTLTDLTLSKCHMHVAHMRKLADAPLIERLQSLDLSKNRLGPNELCTLFKRSSLPSLERLLLSFNHIHEIGLRELLSHQVIPQLTHLDLYANALPPHALRALFNSSRFKSLTSLSLGLNRLSPELMRDVLPHSPLWLSTQGLTHLNLDFVQTFDTDAIIALGKQGQFESLEHLSMSGCMLHDDIMHTLVEHHDLQAMRKLELNLNAISSHGFHSLCSASMPSLHHLVLSHNAIDAHVVNVLPHAQWVPHMTHLDLRDNLFNERVGIQLRSKPSIMLIDKLLLD